MQVSTTEQKGSENTHYPSQSQATHIMISELTHTQNTVGNEDMHV
jgi:hypothetical protein